MCRFGVCFCLEPDNGRFWNDAPITTLVSNYIPALIRPAIDVFNHTPAVFARLHSIVNRQIGMFYSHFLTQRVRHLII